MAIKISTNKPTMILQKMNENFISSSMLVNESHNTFPSFLQKLSDLEIELNEAVRNQGFPDRNYVIDEIKLLSNKGIIEAKHLLAKYYLFGSPSNSDKFFDIINNNTKYEHIELNLSYQEVQVGFELYHQIILDLHNSIIDHVDLKREITEELYKVLTSPEDLRNKFYLSEFLRSLTTQDKLTELLIRLLGYNGHIPILVKYNEIFENSSNLSAIQKETIIKNYLTVANSSINDIETKNTAKFKLFKIYSEGLLGQEIDLNEAINIISKSSNLIDVFNAGVEIYKMKEHYEASKKLILRGASLEVVQAWLNENEPSWFVEYMKEQNLIKEFLK